MEANLHLSSRQLHSPHNLSAIVNVITWFLLVASGLAILTRLLTKRALERRIDIDDALAVAALVGHADTLNSPL
jgi:arginine exporter protein ArgO